MNERSSKYSTPPLRSSTRRLLVFVAFLLSLFPPSTVWAVQALKVSSNGRFLQTANGSPFFWMGDTNWRLYKLSREDVDRYLDDRAAKGFNVIQGPVLLSAKSNIEFRNFYGFSNTDPGVHPPGWFNHIDYIVNAADQRGMYVALVATWGQYISRFGTSTAQRVESARAYGEWLGARYKNNNNVIWIVAGEFNVLGTGDDVQAVWEALGSGLKTGCEGRNLITIHASYQSGRQSSSTMFQNASWLSFNMIQSGQSGNTGSGSDNFHLVEVDYALAPVKPTIDGEAHYEGITGWDDFGVRRRAYWSVFAGAFGHTYGADSVWQSYRGGNDVIYNGSTTLWSDALKMSGATDMQHLRRLIESRPMLQRVPAHSMITTWAGNVPERMIATRDAQGRYAMVYVPKKDKTFTINTTPLTGAQVKAWWYDCRNGKSFSAGKFAPGGFGTFTTPDYGQDWVLVLDDVAQGFSRPGVGGPQL